jgi:hypothetical protein
MTNKPEPPIDEIRRLLKFVWEVIEHGRDSSGPAPMGALNKVEQWAKPINEKIDGGGGRDEWKSHYDAIRPQLTATDNALLTLQDKLATLDGWRHSVAWEVVEETIDTLKRGLFDAYHYHTKPKDCRHWREKYPDRGVL